MFRFLELTSALSLSTSASSMFSDWMNEKKDNLGHLRVNVRTIQIDTKHPLYKLSEINLSKLFADKIRVQAGSIVILEDIFIKLIFWTFKADMRTIGSTTLEFQPRPDKCKVLSWGNKPKFLMALPVISEPFWSSSGPSSFICNFCKFLQYFPINNKCFELRLLMALNKSSWSLEPLDFKRSSKAGQ